MTLIGDLDYMGYLIFTNISEYKNSVLSEFKKTSLFISTTTLSWSEYWYMRSLCQEDGVTILCSGSSVVKALCYWSDGWGFKLQHCWLATAGPLRHLTVSVPGLLFHGMLWPQLSKRLEYVKNNYFTEL